MLQNKRGYHRLKAHKNLREFCSLYSFCAIPESLQGRKKKKKKGKHVASGLFLLSLYPMNDTGMSFIGFYAFCCREEFMHLGA